MTDRQHAGGWVARTRITALMFGTGAVLVALSVLPAQPPAVARGPILGLSLLAGLAAVLPLGLRSRFTVGMSHGLAAAGSAMIAGAVWLAGGTFLSLLYGTLFVWVAQYAAVVFGWRLAFAHAAWGAALHALATAALPPAQRLPAWTVTVGTTVVVILSYRLFDRLSARLRTLVERSGAVLTIVDEHHTVTAHRGPLERLLGFDADEVVGHPLVGLVHPGDRRHVTGVLTRALAEAGLSTATEARMVRADDSVLHVQLSVENAADDPAVGGLVVTLRDVTTQKALEDQLTHQAFHDPLTDLANRALFLDRLDHALARGGRAGGAVAVLYIDLDDFKSVNDTLGHGAGDRLLQVLAGRIRGMVRDGDTVARLGGDEFAVLVEDLESEEALGELGRRLVETLDRPVELGGVEVFVGASVGGTVAVPGSRGAAGLVRDADVAMYRAKERGKGRYQRFDPAMHEALLRRLQLRTELRHALERDQLTLVYQPTVDLRSGEIHGVEALLRWQHPELGLVSPGEFVPLAEESGLIVPIGRWVLQQACGQAVAWQRLRPGTPLTINVNVSSRQLERDSFLEDVSGVLATSGLDPRSLVLEITESVLVGDLHGAVGRLHDLRGLGVRIAIDDFGTGYSSLSYLNELPVDLIKIDKSFVDPLTTRPERTDLVASIVQVGRTLGIGALAEGIEHAVQADVLRAIPVDYGQGYLFGRPAEARAVTELLRGEGPLTPTLSHARDGSG